MNPFSSPTSEPKAKTYSSFGNFAARQKDIYTQRDRAQQAVYDAYETNRQELVKAFSVSDTNPRAISRQQYDQLSEAARKTRDAKISAIRSATSKALRQNNQIRDQERNLDRAKKVPPPEFISIGDFGSGLEYTPVALPESYYQSEDYVRPPDPEGNPLSQAIAQAARGNITQEQLNQAIQENAKATEALVPKVEMPETFVDVQRKQAKEIFDSLGVTPEMIEGGPENYNKALENYAFGIGLMGTEGVTNRLQAQLNQPTQTSTISPFGYTKDQANKLAQELIIFGNFGDIRNTDTGEIVNNPLEYLSNAIYSNGIDAVTSQLEGAGLNFYGPTPKSYMTYETASAIANDLYKAGDYRADANKSDWINNLQRKGLDETLAEWQNSGNKGALTPKQIEGYDLTAGLEDFYAQQENAFQNNIQNILAGQDVRPSFGENLTAKDAITQAFIASNNRTDNENFNYWVNYAEKFGVDTALNLLNQQFTQTYSRPDVLESIRQPQEAFTPTGVYEADFSGLTNVPTQDQYATSGIYQAPSFTPPPPTTGLPAITSAFPTTYQPAPYTPPSFITATPERPTLSPAQQLIGAPNIGRPVGAPIQALTAQEAGSQFVPPTQEDYFAYFGYTPEQLNAAQFLAEMEGAPRAGIAAQTVPVLPAAVAGAPTGMKEGGSVKNSGLMAAAEDLASKGRNGDKMLVHMTVDEVNDLQNYAQQLGGSLTINPYTGLPEANFLKRVGRGLKKIARSPLALPLVAAFAAPYLPAIAGSTAVTAGLLGAAGTMLGGGDLQQGLQRGLMAGMGASAAQSMGYQGIPGVPTSAQAGALQSSGSALGAGVDAGAVSLTPSPGDLDYISAADKTLLGRTTDYLYNIPSAVGDGLSKMDLGDAAMLGYVGMGAAGLKENQQAQKEYEQYLATQTAERDRRKRAGTEAFERAFAAEGGLINFAGGGMTYAEGGGTTDVTNEPRMVKGTGDGMSDSVPATIEGVQEARLANDEFVVPADVVADLGNGSSSAGAQQLYDMMDRVRQARHGTTEQPPEIDVRKIMPA